MKIAARNPAISVTIPPPTATTRLERSAPRSTICSASCSICERRLLSSPPVKKSISRFAAAECRENTLSIDFPDIARGNQENAAVSRRQVLGKALDYASLDHRRVCSLRRRNLKLGHPVPMIPALQSLITFGRA